jgi:hypothetical protein
MNNKAVAVVAGVVALLAGAWIGRDTALESRVRRSVGLTSGDATPSTSETLKSAGVHKCQGAGGITYLDRPCPRGSRELAANGGTVTVMSFPKVAPAAPAAASGLMGGPIVKGMSREEIDKLRDKQVEDAANR